jgi:hypothetical protein
MLFILSYIEAALKCSCYAYLKVVGNEKEGGAKKVANDRNWPQTAAIEVCLPYNFAVVFDFVYFRFRPSKAK